MLTTVGRNVKIEGSGNVFADLGIPNAEGELVKAQLTFQIAKRIKEPRSLSQVAIALTPIRAQASSRDAVR